jgi:hypothetical protein
MMLTQKQGNWVNGQLQGPGCIIHADHKLIGSFIGNDNMAMPVEQLFFKSGYSRHVVEPQLVDMAQ